MENPRDPNSQRKPILNPPNPLSQGGINTNQFNQKMKNIHQKIKKGLLIGVLVVALINFNSVYAAVSDRSEGGTVDQATLREQAAQNPLPEVDDFAEGDEAARAVGLNSLRGLDKIGTGMDVPVDPTPEEDGSKDNESLSFSDLAKKVAQAFTLVNHLFNPLIHFFTFQIGNFLNNDYIYGDKMGEMLHGLWVIVRNIVNIIFALLLLVIAFINVVQPSSDSNYGFKKMLPKFALLLIAVNFSWLGTKVILDAANVVTNVVFAIPSGISPIAEKGLKQCHYDTTLGRFNGSCQLDISYVSADGDKEDVNYSAEDCPKEEDVEKSYKTKAAVTTENGTVNYMNKRIFCWKTMDLNDYNQNNASLFLSHGVIKIQELGKYSQPGIDKIFIGTIFALVLQIVFLTAFLVLWITLVVRIAVLWIMVAFSPLFVLAWFIKDFNIDLPDEISFGTFMEYAFVPAKVGAVLSVGIVMIVAGQGMSKDWFQKPLLDGQSGKGYIMTSGTFFGGITSIQEFIWLLMVVIIVWQGIFKALEKTSIVKTFTDQIKGYGEKAAGLVASSPKWAPIIPIYNEKGGTTHGVSLSSMDPLRKVEELAAHFSRSAREDLDAKDASTILARNNGNIRENLVRYADGHNHEKLISEVTGNLNLNRSDLEKKSEESLAEIFQNGKMSESDAKRVAHGIKLGLRAAAETPPPAAGNAAAPATGGAVAANMVPGANGTQHAAHPDHSDGDAAPAPPATGGTPAVH